MKRVVLMVMLLVAGGLALVYLSIPLEFLLLFAGFAMSTGSGGIGSVSADVSGLVFAPVLPLGASFLLWRVCGTLAAGGDRVMAWHRRFHGWATIVGPLLILSGSVVGLGVLAFAVARTDPITPGGDGTWMLVFAVMALVVASVGLSVMQLRSAVVAFRALQRGDQDAPRLTPQP